VLARADAVPVLLPAGLDTRSIGEFVAGADGVLLPGGVDPHPRHFGEEPHPRTVIDEALDALEFTVVAAAIGRGLPILGICRGSQVLNVALGGSLVQHLPTDPIDHNPDGPLDRHVHGIEFVDGTRLRALAGVPRLDVNSWHHQAISRVATGLRVAAVATDGVVEAVEAVDGRSWMVGVQYHPEELIADHPAHQALFHSFLAACRQAGPRAAGKAPGPGRQP
jgi:putative glutamine amidotransferase